MSGLKAKTETAIQNKVLKTQLTPWEEYLLKKKEKKRQTRLEKKKVGERKHGSRTKFVILFKKVFISLDRHSYR